MIFHIKALSTYARHIIQNEATGSVHSVYRNTVNITVNGRLLALQTANSPISPISLITDCADFLAEKGQVVAFDCSQAIIYDLAPAGLIPHETRHDLYRKFSHVIKNSKVNGYNLIFLMSPKVSQDLILTVAETKIHEANTLFHKGRYQEVAVKIGGLIGLGIGLTPSGDDFLCGVLAGLYIQGKERSEFAVYLKDYIRENLHRTNEISQAFLSCALDGHFSLAVNKLWNNPGEEEISEMFHAIGHSSGIDTLCGIYYLFFLMEW